MSKFLYVVYNVKELLSIKAFNTKLELVNTMQFFQF